MKIPPWAMGLPWREIVEACFAESCPVYLLSAIVQVESSGIAEAVRKEPDWKYFYKVDEFAKKLGIPPEEEKALQAQSYGLCQVMGSVARELGFCGPLNDLFDVKTNLKYGARKLHECLERYPFWYDAAAAYNAGSVRKKGANYVNQRYVDRVRSYMKQFEDY